MKNTSNQDYEDMICKLDRMMTDVQKMLMDAQQLLRAVQNEVGLEMLLGKEGARDYGDNGAPE